MRNQNPSSMFSSTTTSSTAAVANETSTEFEEDISPEEFFSAWDMIDFPNFQHSLEDQVNQVVDKESHRLEQRKEIAAKTRDFRNNDVLDHDTKLFALDVIKLYQNSLDSVSTEAKFNSNCFITAFKMLRNLPDPCHPAIKNRLRECEMLHHQIQVLTEREHVLINSLRNHKEKLKGFEDLKQSREDFQAKLEFDFQAQLEMERIKDKEILSALQIKYEEEIARLTVQLEQFQEESLPSPPPLLVTNHNDSPSSDFQVEKEADGKDDSLAVAQQKFHETIADLNAKHQEITHKYLVQIDHLQSHLHDCMEEISLLKSELQLRPTAEEHAQVRTQLKLLSQLSSQTTDGNGQQDGGIIVEEDLVEKLDGLEAWLLRTNQRLVKELEVATARNRDLQSKTTSSSLSDRGVAVEEQQQQQSVENDVSLNGVALRNQRDRLRAKLEKRDLEIEQLTNKIDTQEHQYRRALEDADKLRQRLRFLQSYKTSERSTLLVGSGVDEDVEKQPAVNQTVVGGGLGRGVGHQFRTLWDEPKRSGKWTRQQKIFASVLGFYLVGIHALLGLVVAFWCGGNGGGEI